VLASVLGFGLPRVRRRKTKKPPGFPGGFGVSLLLV
jgi:hypothetical protein